ncbi:MAG: galactitol-1-phosphate 5-dehydrogenase [Kiritimatiellales bacterium]
MKALVHNQANDFMFQDVPEPEIRAHDVLIEVKAVGICGSDVHGMTGKTGRRQPPIIMGHEAAGIIKKTGAGVTDYRTGDRVTFDSTIYCNECSFCRQGKINLCDNRRVLGVSCDEYKQDGAMAEYVSVPEHILYKIPDQMTFPQAAMIEAVSIAFHAVARSRIQLNQSVAVFGCGIIGLLIIQAAKLAGCGTVWAIDLDQKKLEFAKKFGADFCLNSSADAEHEIKAKTGNAGADIIFEAVGIQPTITAAIDAVKKGGTVTLVGNLSPEITLPLQKVVTQELNILGSCASTGEYQVCIDMIVQGRIDVDSLISKTVPLSEGREWFNALAANQGDLFKVVLVP